MKTGSTSTFLNSDIGREYVDKFSKIHAHLNAQDPYFYLPKYEIIQDMIDQKYLELFG